MLISEVFDLKWCWLILDPCGTGNKTRFLVIPLHFFIKLRSWSLHTMTVAVPNLDETRGNIVLEEGVWFYHWAASSNFLSKQCLSLSSQDSRSIHFLFLLPHSRGPPYNPKKYVHFSILFFRPSSFSLVTSNRTNSFWYAPFPSSVFSVFTSCSGVKTKCEVEGWLKSAFKFIWESFRQMSRFLPFRLGLIAESDWSERAIRDGALRPQNIWSCSLWPVRHHLFVKTSVFYSSISCDPFH